MSNNKFGYRNGYLGRRTDRIVMASLDVWWRNGNSTMLKGKFSLISIFPI